MHASSEDAHRVTQLLSWVDSLTALDWASVQAVLTMLLALCVRRDGLSTDEVDHLSAPVQHLAPPARRL